MKKLFFNIWLFVALYASIPTSLSCQVLGLELLNGKNETEIEFEYSQGFILLDVKFGNALPLRFILDTGAEHIIVFNKTITDLLGLKYDKRINLVGSDLEREVFAYICRNTSLYLENCKSVTRDIIVLEEDFLHLEELTGETIHGIIGSRFFRGLILDIDYKKEKLKLINGSRSIQYHLNNYEEIDLEIKGHKPYLTGKMKVPGGEEIDLNLLVDTGSALPFLAFMDTHPSLNLPDQFIKGNLGKGLGGNIEGYLSITQQLKISKNYGFSNLITSFQNIPDGVDSTTYRSRNGLIGNPILARFHVVIDFVKNKMFLKPNRNYNKEFDYDKSGLTVYAFGPHLNNFYVKDVISGSAGDLAGIQKGDMIKRIGLWPAHFYSLKQINDKFHKKSGKKIRLVLERNGVTYKTKLILKDMLSINAQKSLK